MKNNNWIVGTTVLAAILALLAVTQRAQADEWSEGDKWRQGVYTVLHVLDWQQTHFISNYPGSHVYEINPMIKGKPDSGEIDKYFAATLIVHFVIVDQLPRKWRKRFQCFTIGSQAAIVGWNHSAGIKIRF